MALGVPILKHIRVFVSESYMAEAFKRKSKDQNSSTTVAHRCNTRVL